MASAEDMDAMEPYDACDAPMRVRVRVRVRETDGTEPEEL
jgi:hypothetical protein